MPENNEIPEVVSKKIYAVTGNPVVETGLISFRFMASRGVDFRKFMGYAKMFGFLCLKKKPDNYIDPYKLARHEPGAIGDDGVKRWEIQIFESGKGLVVYGSGDETKDGEFDDVLVSFFKDLPDCVLLMDRSIFDRFQKACAMAENVTLDFVHCDGEVPTA